MTLTQARLKEVLHYDSATGFFTWRAGNGCVKAGSTAGSLQSDGCVYIYICTGDEGEDFLAHQLAWLYTEGYFPENGIEHINRLRDDNRRINLREASRPRNSRNAGDYSSNGNESGVLGVYFDKRNMRFLAHITIYDNPYSLGYYDSLIEAACARYAAEQCLEWNDCDDNSSAYQYLKENGLQLCQDPTNS